MRRDDDAGSRDETDAAPAVDARRADDVAAAETQAADSEPGGPVGALVPGGARIGRFVVRERVGAGGMGEVYAAHDPLLDRIVAVKVLHPAARGAPVARHLLARLHREAQAAARLSHRNVVTVYDVGIAELAGRDELFVAMAFVDGGTLDDWTCARGRSWREVVAIYVQAGRGLAAAHAAGIVHRDFKPGNVLVTRGGEPMVTDFGLASSAGELAPSGSGDASAGVPASDAGSLTRTGAVMGTPIYMAPEQHRGERVDARADQFAFAVALYRAVYGIYPFGDTLEQVRRRIDAAPAPPPSPGPAPPALLAILRRGLRFDPAERYPNMEALLSELERLVARRPRRAAMIAAGAAALVAGGAVVLALGRGAAPPACDGARGQIETVWGAPQREAVARAFDATARPFAEEASARVVDQLDRWAGAWVAAHTAACRATHVDRTQSPRAFELRATCFERQRANLASVVAFLSEIEADALPRASQVVLGLPAPEDCADVVALEAAEPATDPALLDRLGEAKVRLTAGRYADGIPVASEVLDAARARELAALGAEAGYVLGTLQLRAGDATAARAVLFQAALDAERSGQHELAVRAWANVIGTMIEGDTPPEEEARCFALGGAALARAGAAPRAEAHLLHMHGSYLSRASKDASFIPVLEQALARARAGADPDDPMILAILADLGHELARRVPERHAEGIAMERDALAARERELGAHHPVVAPSLHNLALTLVRDGELVEAERLLRRALQLKTETLPPGHVSTSNTLIELGTLLAVQGRFDEAIAYARQDLALWEQRDGPRSYEVSVSLQDLGKLLVTAGRHDEALEALERGIAICDAHDTAKAARQAVYLRIQRIWALTEAGRLDAAAAALRALAPAEAELPARMRVVLALERARLALRRRRAKEALQVLHETERRVIADQIVLRPGVSADFDLLFAEVHRALDHDAAARHRAEAARAICLAKGCAEWTVRHAARAAAILDAGAR